MLLALAVPAAAPADSTHSIQVYAEGDRGNNVIATFTQATCFTKPTKIKGRTSFRAAGVSTDGAFELTLFIPIWEGTGPEKFNSWFVPPFESFAIGRVAFRNDGHLLGIGYGPALWNEGETKAVFFTGVVKCEPKKTSPKKGKPGKDGAGGKNGKGGKKGKPGKH